MPKKIILFGCQSISIEILRFLNYKPDVEVVKVFTYEVISDISRGQESIKAVASELGIDVSSPSKISLEQIEEVKNLKPDLIISAYYRKIFPKGLIDIPPLGIINIHPSFLPHYRGPVPTAWAILNGESDFGITIHKVDTGIDTGDILAQCSYPIDDDETGYDLYVRAMGLGASLLIRNFDEIIEDKITPIKQPNGGSYYGKLKVRKNLDWKQSAQMIKNNVRVRARPYNPIEAVLDNKYFFINKVEIIQDHGFPIQIPGRILKVSDDDTFFVSCSDGVVHVLDYGVYPPFTSIEKKLYLKVGRAFDDEN